MGTLKDRRSVGSAEGRVLGLSSARGVIGGRGKSGVHVSDGEVEGAPRGVASVGSIRSLRLLATVWQAQQRRCSVQVRE